MSTQSRIDKAELYPFLTRTAVLSLDCTSAFFRGLNLQPGGVRAASTGADWSL